MGAPSSDPGLEALIAPLHRDAEGRVCGASTFIVDHAERRRADGADERHGDHEKCHSSSRTAVDRHSSLLAVPVWYRRSCPDQDPLIRSASRRRWKKSNSKFTSLSCRPRSGSGKSCTKSEELRLRDVARCPEEPD
jgi:hypothetical protein